MKFETVQELIQKGKKPKVFAIDYDKKDIYADPLLYAGFAVETDEEATVKAVYLQPYVGLNIAHSCTGCEPYTGKDKMAVTLETKNYKITSFTTSFDAHEKQARLIVNKVCKKETDSFKEYLKSARELSV